MKIAIKNMVCKRCIFAVQHIFALHQIQVTSIKLGEAITVEDISPETLDELRKSLEQIGFSILEDQSLKMIEKIKLLLINKISTEDIEENFVISQFLSDQLSRDYSSLSKLFSQVENTTLEQYFISQKIEKTKELLIYNELTLTEISARLGYKTVQHLSKQFKTNTGFSPSEFKKLKNNPRLSLDKV